MGGIFAALNDFTAGFSAVHEVDDLDIILPAKTSGEIPDCPRGIVLCLSVNKGKASSPAERVEQPGKGGFCFTATGGGKKHDMPGEVIHAQPELTTDIIDTAVTDIKIPRAGDVSSASY